MKDFAPFRTNLEVISAVVDGITKVFKVIVFDTHLLELLFAPLDHFSAASASNDASFVACFCAATSAF